MVNKPRGLAVITGSSTVMHKFLDDGTAIIGNSESSVTDMSGTVKVFGTVSASSNISASAYYGDGSNLEGLGASSLNDGSVTNAKLDNMAANTVKVRNANTLGAPSDLEVSASHLLIGNGDGFTAAELSGDATMSNTGVVTLSSSQTAIQTVYNTGLKLGRAAGDTYIDFAAADDNIDFYAGATKIIDLTTTGVDITGALTTSADATFTGDTNTFSSANSTVPLIEIKNTTNDANGARLRFVKDKGAAGADNDVAGIIEFYADDDNEDQVLFAQIKATVADASNGAEGGKLELGVASHDGEMNAGITITDGSVEDEIDVTIGKGANSVTTIAGDLTVTGTTTTVNQTVVNNTTDVLVFEGASADAHETTLKVTEPTADASFSLPALSAGNYHIPALAGTATQASAAVTAAEFALLDGGSSIGTTAVADGDGIFTNDGGVMKHTRVQTFQTYFDANSVGGTNVVTVGALDAGSITSNFGTINNGGSTITTTGLISGGSLDIDNVLIDGTTIGHTDDTDILTVGAQSAAFAADVDVNIAKTSGLQLGGTAVTTTAAELNLIDGGTARGTDAVATGDGILINDNGTMKMTNVDTVSTYFAAHSVGGTNMVTVGALGAGSITTGFGNIDNGTSNITTGGLLSIDIDSGATINTAGGGVGAAGSITLGAGADAGLYVKSDDLHIENKTSDKDIIFRGNDGGTFKTIATVDASEGTFKIETAGKLDYAGTLVTATGAELNYLDNDALEAADLTKLAALDVTAAELNIMDGDTAATGTTLVVADRVVVNDAGTMKQVAMSDFETFMETNLDTLSSVTTVGALDAGSITSGFGHIDNGESNITTGGLLSVDVDSGATVNTAGGGVGAAGSITLGAGDDAGLYVKSDDLYIENKTSDKDIIFRGNDGGTFTTIATVDASEGTFKVETADINGGAIDGTIIGAATAAAGTFTDLTVSGDMTVAGDVTVNTTLTKNTWIKDKLVLIGSGSSDSKAGFLFHREETDIGAGNDRRYGSFLFDGSNDNNTFKLGASKYTGESPQDLTASHANHTIDDDDLGKLHIGHLVVSTTADGAGAIDAGSLDISGNAVISGSTTLGTNYNATDGSDKVTINGSLQLGTLDGNDSTQQDIMEYLATNRATLSGQMVYVTNEYTASNSHAAYDSFDAPNKFYFCENGVWHSSVFAVAEE